MKGRRSKWRIATRVYAACAIKASISPPRTSAISDPTQAKSTSRATIANISPMARWADLITAQMRITGRSGCLRGSLGSDDGRTWDWWHVDRLEVGSPWSINHSSAIHSWGLATTRRAFPRHYPRHRHINGGGANDLWSTRSVCWVWAQPDIRAHEGWHGCGESEGGACGKAESLQISAYWSVLNSISIFSSSSLVRSIWGLISLLGWRLLYQNSVSWIIKNRMLKLIAIILSAFADFAR